MYFIMYIVIHSCTIIFTTIIVWFSACIVILLILLFLLHWKHGGVFVVWHSSQPIGAFLTKFESKESETETKTKVWFELSFSKIFSYILYIIHRTFLKAKNYFYNSFFLYNMKISVSSNKTFFEKGKKNKNNNWELITFWIPLVFVLISYQILRFFVRK